MSPPAEVTNLLSRRVYTVHQVDRILGLHSGTAHRWIDGYARSGNVYPPVVREESTGDEYVTWGEFAETRLLAEFRGAGVPMVHLRPTVGRLRKVFTMRYPLAHAAPLLEAEGRELVWSVQEELHLEKALRMVVRTDQLTLSQPAARFAAAVDFSGDQRGIARLRPIAELARVWVDPLRQFGEPAVRSVPTAVIAEQYRAGDTIPFIAKAYELTEDDINDAIRYELQRASAARAA